MTPEHFRLVEELFHRARALPAEARPAFLAAQCNGDAAVRREVEALLAQLDAPQTPTVDAAAPPRRPSRAAQPADAAAPPAIPDYDLGSSIGRGGFGAVWLARQKLTGVYYAVKIVAASAGAALELDGLRHYKQRAAEHPNLVQIEHVGELTGRFYYAMELADDARGSGVRAPEGYEPTTLDDELRRRGRLPVAEATAVVTQLLDGLSVLHAAGLLHRDIKPANILRCKGRWKLGDVGLVAHSGRQNVAAGTPAYLPPEGVVDRTGDLFAVGVLLTQLLAGTLPPRRSGSVGDSPAAATTTAPAPRGGLAAVCQRACAAAPAERFQTAAEMRAALHTAARPRRARRVAWLVLAAATVGGLGWAWSARRVARPTPPAVAAEPDIRIFYKRHATDGEQLLSAGALPLTIGNLLRCEVTLPQPAYPLLYLLFSDDPPLREYPATANDARPVAAFQVPPLSADPQRQQWRSLAPPVGAGAYLLLLADEPVGDLAAIDRALNSVRLTSAADLHTLWIGDPFNPVAVAPAVRGVSEQLVTAPRRAVRVPDNPALARFARRRLIAFPYVASPTTAPEVPP
ncbi:MAG: serine/threonine-protein kinase [Phycisphaerae bacterium]